MGHGIVRREYLRRAKLGIKPGLHGVGEAGLGKVDHGQAGPLDVAVLHCILDEPQHEGLEVVRGIKVAVVCHVLLKVAAPRVDADALGKRDVHDHGDGQVVDALDCHGGDFALLPDPDGPGVGVAQHQGDAAAALRDEK